MFRIVVLERGFPGVPEKGMCEGRFLESGVTSLAVQVAVGIRDPDVVSFLLHVSQGFIGRLILVPVAVLNKVDSLCRFYVGFGLLDFANGRGADIGLSALLYPDITPCVKCTRPPRNQRLRGGTPVIMRSNPAARVVPSCLHDKIRVLSETLLVLTVSPRDRNHVPAYPVRGEHCLENSPVGGGTLAIIPVRGVVVVKRDQVLVGVEHRPGGGG